MGFGSARSCAPRLPPPRPSSGGPMNGARSDEGDPIAAKPTSSARMKLPLQLLFCLSACPAVSGSYAGVVDDDGVDSERATAAAFELQVTASGNGLTVVSREAAVEDILLEISRQNGLVVRIEGSISASLTLEFHDLPLDQALRRVLADQNYLLGHNAAGGRPGSAGSPPGRLWVFASGNTDAPGSAPPSPDGAVSPAKAARGGARPDWR